MRISEIYVYPVKSLAGIQLGEAKLTPLGLENDRRWMIVDKHNRFVTQRKLPKLATIQPRYTAGGQLVLSNINSNNNSNSNTTNESPPLELCNRYTRLETVTVWKDQCEALPAIDTCNDWLTESVQSDKALRLMQFSSVFQRAPNNTRFDDHSTLFADAAPYLICNQSSLDQLNEHLQTRGEPKANIQQFRPNIVISGVEAFNEHKIAYAESIDENIQFCFRDHCQRCAVITIDQTSGKRQAKNSPLKTLTQLNSMPNNTKTPAFGVNCTLEAGQGKRLHVGMPFKLINSQTSTTC